MNRQGTTGRNYLALGVLLAAVAVTASLGRPASATTRSWNDGTANWSPGTWSPSGVPGSGEAVNIVFTDGVARTVTYNVSAPSLGLLSIDLTGGAGTTSTTLSISDNNNLTANGILVGGYSGVGPTNGSGAINQSAGTVTTNSGWDLVVGYGANSTGTYSLSGTGALVANQSEYVGLYGNGTFNHAAGTNTIATATGFFEVGTYATATGTYNLGGTGALAANTNEYIGDIGTGSFNQNGGTNTISGAGHHLYLGYNASGAGGTYTLASGALAVNNGNEYVGYSAPGNINQSGGNFSQTGGTNNVAADLYVGYSAGATGAYTLGGTGSLSSSVSSTSATPPRATSTRVAAHSTRRAARTSLVSSPSAIWAAAARITSATPALFLSATPSTSALTAWAPSTNQAARVALQPSTWAPLHLATAAHST